MVEVFKTNVRHAEQASVLRRVLQQHLPQCRIVFDLDDCDRILKVAGESFSADAVMRLVQQNGFDCTVLD